MSNDPEGSTISAGMAHFVAVHESAIGPKPVVTGKPDADPTWCAPVLLPHCRLERTPV